MGGPVSIWILRGYLNVLKWAPVCTRLNRYDLDKRGFRGEKRYKEEIGESK